MCITPGSRTLRYSENGVALLELARICLEQARITQAPNVAAELRRMAKDYQRRAALLAAVTAKERNAGVGDQLWLRSSSSPTLQSRTGSSLRCFARSMVILAQVMNAGRADT
jgi:hypothetical protein